MPVPAPAAPRPLPVTALGRSHSSWAVSGWQGARAIAPATQQASVSLPDLKRQRQGGTLGGAGRHPSGQSGRAPQLGFNMVPWVPVFTSSGEAGGGENLPAPSRSSHTHSRCCTGQKEVQAALLPRPPESRNRSWEVLGDLPWGRRGMVCSCLLPLVCTLPPPCTEASPGKTEANRPAVCPGSAARKRPRGLQPPLSGPKPWLLLPLHATPGSLTPASTGWLRACCCQRRGGRPGLPGTVLTDGSGSCDSRVRPNDLMHMLSAKALATELVK